MNQFVERQMLHGFLFWHAGIYCVNSTAPSTGTHVRYSNIYLTMTMKKALVITALLLAALIPGCKEVENPPQSYREGALLDVNETSSTFGQYILPEDFEGYISVWLFGHSTWTYCRAQFGRLDELQKKLDRDNPESGIFILGVNRAGCLALHHCAPVFDRGHLYLILSPRHIGSLTD